MQTKGAAVCIGKLGKINLFIKFQGCFFYTTREITIPLNIPELHFTCMDLVEFLQTFKGELWQLPEREVGDGVGVSS